MPFGPPTGSDTGPLVPNRPRCRFPQCSNGTNRDNGWKDFVRILAFPVSVKNSGFALFVQIQRGNERSFRERTATEQTLFLRHHVAKLGPVRSISVCRKQWRVATRHPGDSQGPDFVLSNRIVVSARIAIGSTANSSVTSGQRLSLRGVKRRSNLRI